MIDLSTLKAPGWQRVVADLTTPAPDDRVFGARLLGALGQVSGARQALLFTVPPGGEDDTTGGNEPRPIMAWPATPGQTAGVQTPVDEHAVVQPAEVKASVRSSAGTRQTRVFGLDKDDQLYDGQGKGYVVAVPLLGSAGGSAGDPGRVSAVVTLVLEGRSRQALQTTLALIELLAGYAHIHGVHQTLRRTRSAAAALDLAARLIASMNTARGFKGATLQLVNDVCRQLAVDRVALGWVRGAGKPGGRTNVRVEALSDTEQIDRRMAMLRKIEAAMEECLDQEQPVVYPAPPAQSTGESPDEADALLSQAVTHAHRELAAADARLRVASLPLRLDDRVTGVLLVESAGGGQIDTATIELVQSAMDLVTPVLESRRSDDRLIVQRVWDWTMRTSAWAVGPRHTGWKLAGLAGLALVAVCTLIPVPYRIGAPMEIEAALDRRLAAPFEGVIEELGPNAEAGRRVEQGEVLVRLRTTELELQALDGRSQVAQYLAQADESLKKGEQSKVEQAQERAAQAQARVDLLEAQIAQAVIAAPISGTIISGTLKDRIGSRVQLGEELLRLADLNDLRIVASVDDRDVGLIREGMKGYVATKSEPARTLPIIVTRIVPLAQALDGKNTFTARAVLDAEALRGTDIEGFARSLRPGMEGQVRLSVDRRSLVSIGSRRIEDALRLWLWW